MTEEEWRTSVTWVGIIACCLLEKDGAYLLVQEKQPKVYGKWNLPAGWVDKDESIEDAAVREAREETGYNVELIEKLAIYHESAQKNIKHVFGAKIIGGELKIQENEILDAKWLSYEDISALNKSNQLRELWIWDVISKTRNQK